METDRLYAISKVLSDPTRFEILKRIAAADEIACAALKEAFPVTQATISHHLRELQEAGLIEVRRQAKYMHVKLNDAVWSEYVRALAALLPHNSETR
ncbi:MAG: helix-turn-helix transcriptional regulator [Acidobacteriaceae bacterium]|nr:helix-turn-helix transcriptional regulator [Acidobacteriaceae bacterium]MBV9036460.1 helix-turn-helix transcriptional regulator [Acidobacteriaceae bacterium]MBV9225806.1 helix-turn-helix transcriptional regulator [Acidobacteriaceae bacterium]MBV9305438.1 helix-turn-helix transcriptional regulator [Acidobacteriaceae bacterium]MBV9675137.1 helix-turn-helix transcriptional regulator [Acidobacteriaceae bacterium]